MAYGFCSIFRANLYVVWFVCDCVMVKDRFHRVLGLFKIEHCVSRQQKSRAEWQTGVCPNFLHTLVNRPCQLWTSITFSFELRFERSWTLRKAHQV